MGLMKAIQSNLLLVISRRKAEKSVGGLEMSSHSSVALLYSMASSQVIWIYRNHMASVSSKEKILWRVPLLYHRCIMEQVYADRTGVSPAPAQTQHLLLHVV